MLKWQYFIMITFYTLKSRSKSKPFNVYMGETAFYITVYKWISYVTFLVNLKYAVRHNSCMYSC